MESETVAIEPAAAVDLSTTYLGLRLPHPFMPGASPLVNDLDTVRQLEDAGAAAIVMHSLFEEQVEPAPEIRRVRRVAAGSQQRLERRVVGRGSNHARQRCGFVRKRSGSAHAARPVQSPYRVASRRANAPLAARGAGGQSALHSGRAGVAHRLGKSALPRRKLSPAGAEK